MIKTNHTSRILPILAAMIVAGCAGSVAKDEVVSYSGEAPPTLLLGENLEFTIQLGKKSLNNNDGNTLEQPGTFELKAGKFYPLGYSEGGVFYLGESDCFEMRTYKQTRDCGLFRPNETSEIVYVFHYVESHGLKSSTVFASGVLAAAAQSHNSKRYIIENRYSIPLSTFEPVED